MNINIKKNLLLFILFFIYACTEFGCKYTPEYGIVTSIESYKKYNPTIHIYDNAYKIGVQFTDTFIYYIIDTKEPQIGDSILIYK